MTALAWNPAVADQVAAASNQPRPELAPGSAAWIRNDAGVPKRLYYICPCGCGMTKVCLVTKDPFDPSKGGRWHWNGDEEAPTLFPSIRHEPGPNSCGWHGHLESGKWKGAP